MTAGVLVPFRIAIPDEELNDLRDRLARTRWPTELAGAAWSRGVPLVYLQKLAEYWRRDYDWREHERTINEWPQFLASVGEDRMHFFHVRSSHADATPLLLVHGWPGSNIEFTRVVDPLTNPRGEGGHAATAFHLVIPSVPGFGFSGPTLRNGWSVKRIAAALASLMQSLGYNRYFVHGTDLGAMVARELGVSDSTHVEGVHVTQILSFEPPDGEPRSDEERRAREAAVRYQRELSGYSVLQSQRPQTLAYALTDSPVGQLAWIAERFKDWTDAAGDPDEAVDRDHLLTNVSIYWFTRTAGSSAQFYRDADVFGRPPVPSTTPTGVAVFPHDIGLTVRRIAEKTNRIVHWSAFDRGGHFAAMEEPDLLVADLRAFRHVCR